jgi:quercetin dioxygenase-like cupin family protein
MNETLEPAVEVLTAGDSTTLTRPGQTSVQLLWPGNSPQAQVTVTRVTIPPGAANPRHAHPHSEQTWIIERGRAELLLTDEQSRPIQAGEIVRTPAGAIHGIRNSGTEPLIYLAITTPPIDFRPSYDGLT